MRIEKAEITLRDIRMHAFHGVLPEERRKGTEYSLTLRCTLAEPQALVSRARATDDIRDTVDYSRIYELVKEEMAIPSNLLETVATRIGERVLETFPSIATVRIDLEKSDPPLSGRCSGASLSMEFSA